jgi:hypothetical protein
MSRSSTHSFAFSDALLLRLGSETVKLSLLHANMQPDSFSRKRFGFFPDDAVCRIIHLFNGFGNGKLLSAFRIEHMHFRPSLDALQVQADGGTGRDYRLGLQFPLKVTGIEAGESVLPQRGQPDRPFLVAHIVMPGIDAAVIQV